jgi:hypothetical protein
MFHPPAGAESGRCGARPARGQACAQPTAGRSDVLFIKRIVAGPGDRVAFRSGRTVRNGEPVDGPFVDACGVQACDLPRPATVSRTACTSWWATTATRPTTAASGVRCPRSGSSAAPSAVTSCSSPAYRSARARTAHQGWRRRQYFVAIAPRPTLMCDGMLATGDERRAGGVAAHDCDEMLVRPSPAAVPQTCCPHTGHGEVPARRYSRCSGGYTHRRQSDEARSITAVDPLMASIPVTRRRMEAPVKLLIAPATPKVRPAS